MVTEITYENQPEDIVAIFKAQPWGAWLRSLVPLLLYVHLFWPIVLLGFALQDGYLIAAVGGLAVLVVLLLAFVYVRARLNLPKTGRVFPGPQTIRLREEFLEMQNEGGGVRRPWKYVRQVTGLPQHLVIFVQKDRAYVIPRRYFASPAEADQFLATAQSLRQAAQDRPLPTLTWEAFQYDFGLESHQRVRHLQWQHDPKLAARLVTLGLNDDGTKVVPSLGSLVTQLIFPLMLTAVLLFLQYTDPEQLVLYYLLVGLTSLFLLVFGISLHTRHQYARELRNQQGLAQADEAWFFEEGVGSCSPEAVAFSPWQIIDTIEEDREAIVLYDVRPFLYAIIPKTAFPTPEEATAFLERIQACHDTAHDRHDDTILAEVTENPFQSPSSM